MTYSRYSEKINAEKRTNYLYPTFFFTCRISLNNKLFAKHAALKRRFYLPVLLFFSWEEQENDYKKSSFAYCCTRPITLCHNESHGIAARTGIQKPKSVEYVPQVSVFSIAIPGLLMNRWTYERTDGRTNRLRHNDRQTN